MSEKENDEQEELITIQELSHELHVSKRKLREWNKCGILRAVRLAPMGPLKYTHEAVKKFLDNCTINKERDT